MYSVGDEWRRVNRQEDRGGNITDCGVCGSSPAGFGPGQDFGGEPLACCDFNFQCGLGCPAGWQSTTRRDFLDCRRICAPPISTCNTCYQANWFTIYDRFKYEFNQWTYLGSFEVAGQFTA